MALSPLGGEDAGAEVENMALSPLGERVARDRRFHQPARDG